MKNTLSWKSFLAASILGLGLAATAQAEPGRHGERCHSEDGAGPRHGGHGSHDEHGRFGGMPSLDRLPPFLRGIDLSETQRDKLFALRHETAPREHELQKQLRQSRDALHEASRSDKFDAAAARKLADQHGKAIGELALAHAEFAARVRALLTPEQRQAADARRAERRGADR